MINVVIPAAGEATRLRPLSSYTSKVMVRVNGKPCLDYILEQIHASSKVNQIVIVDGKFDDIREYCRVRHPNVDFVKQQNLNGPHDAIRLGIQELRDPSLPLVVWLGDAIILEKNMNLGLDFLLCKEVEDHHNWCMWDGLNFVNKPSRNVPNSVALVGLYSFNDGLKAKEAFEKNPNAYEISDALAEYDSGMNRFNRVLTNKWYDIGDLPTYYKTCASLLNLKSRAFHSMQYDSDLGVIRKRPNFHNEHSIETISNEKKWYGSLTPQQSMFVPRVMPHKTDLILSYESGTLLSDLMLYEQIRGSTWEYIIDKVFRIKLNYFNEISENEKFISDFADSSREMWFRKTIDRVSATKFTTSDRDKLAKIGLGITAITHPIDGMHGDLHFGNILYNQQTDQIKLIDPRGKYANYYGTHGDNIYDFAKLAHDLYHGYNAMVQGVPHNETVKQIFVKMLQKYDLPVQEILDAGLLLIATCVPLHYDDENRQNRFIQYVKDHL